MANKKIKEVEATTTSKRWLCVSFVVAILVTTVCVLMVILTDKDISSLVTLACGVWTETGAYGAFYLWKSKVENRSKYAQKFIYDLADKYGIDAIAPIIQSVIQD